MKRPIALMLLAMLCPLFLFACSKAVNAAPEATYDGFSLYDTALEKDLAYTLTGANRYEDSYDAEYGESAEPAEPASGMIPDPLRKIIWMGEVSIETQNYDDDLDEINRLAEECGGYVQSSSVTGGGTYPSGERRMRSARLTLRIPSEDFRLFMNGTAQIATLLSSSTSSNDITDEYFDNESRLQVLRVKQDRLLDMISKEGSLDELLKLENALSETIYEIESLSGTLRKYDGMISYSTVTLYLNEVTEEKAIPVEDGVIAKLSGSFGRSLSGLGAFLTSVFVFIVGNSPVIVFVLLLGFGVFVIIRAVGRGKAKKNMPPPDNTAN